MMELNGRAVDKSSLEFGDFDYREENPWLEAGYYEDGTPLTDSELDELTDKLTCELHMIFMERAF